MSNKTVQSVLQPSSRVPVDACESFEQSLPQT